MGATLKIWIKTTYLIIVSLVKVKFPGVLYFITLMRENSFVPRRTNSETVQKKRDIWINYCKMLVTWGCLLFYSYKVDTNLEILKIKIERSKIKLNNYKNYGISI